MGPPCSNQPFPQALRVAQTLAFVPRGQPWPQRRNRRYSFACRGWRRCSFTTTLPAFICAPSRRNPASSASVGAPKVNWSRKWPASDFLRRTAVCWSSSPSCLMMLYASASSCCGSVCMPTSSRQQSPCPPAHCSMCSSSCRQPRRLKYPTQKSDRCETRIVVLSVRNSCLFDIVENPWHGRRDPLANPQNS